MKRILLYTLIFLLVPCVTLGSQIFSVPKLQVMDDEGDPASGWTLYFYYAGTSTPLTVYSDSSLSTSIGTSVELDSRGEYGAIYLGASAKVVLKDSDAATKWTVDNWAGGSISPLGHVCLSSYTNLATAISTVGGTETALYLDADDTLGTDLIIPATMTTIPVQGYKVTTGAHTLTIRGPIIGTAKQIADVSGGGTLALSTDSIIEYDSWDDGISGYISINIAGTKKLLLDVAANAADTYIIANKHSDSDGDSFVQVEETADEDIVRIDVAGDEKMYIGADATASYIQVNALMDEDADTMVQVEESADSDIVTIDIAGNEKLNLSADPTTSYVEAGWLMDVDHDTMVAVEGNADEDIVRIYTGGTQRIWTDSTGTSMMNNVKLRGETQLTISSATITVTASYHSVDTEGDAASDDLETINGGGIGQLLILRANNTARTVVAKDGVGNMYLSGDCTLDSTEDTLFLMYHGTNWVEISCSDNY